MKFISKSKTLLATLALAAFAGGVQADAVTIAPHSVGGVLYSDAVRAVTGYSGEAALWHVENQTSGASFLAFCLELAQRADIGVQHDYDPSAYTANDNVKELYARFYGTVLDSYVNAVGFQLALWELTGEINVAQFLFPDNAIDKAQDMLNEVRNGTTPYNPDAYEFVKWSNGQHQDVLQALAAPNAVPEPQTHALMAGGLGLMLLALRARRRKSDDKSK